MRLSQLIDEAVAADKKHPVDALDAALPHVSAAPSTAAQRRRRAAARQAARALVQRCAAARQAPLSTPRRPGTRARSIRSRSACCRSASAMRRKFAQFLLDAHKRYTPPCVSASRRPRGDAEGDIVATRAVAFDARRRSTPRCRASPADQMQLPPAHSALKYAGKPLLRLRARRASRFRASRAKCGSIGSTSRVESAPDATLDVECSKGTYVRALAEDIGEALGCGAHLAALRRTASGGFRSPTR